MSGGKECPRCKNIFQCKANQIQQCHCVRFQFSDEDRKWIGERYQDCLCENCLEEISNELKKKD